MLHSLLVSFRGSYCFFLIPFSKVTPLRYSDVTEVLPVQEVPSGEVRMVPEEPTVTKSPFR